jgi:hypothetical protein
MRHNPHFAFPRNIFKNPVGVAGFVLGVGFVGGTLGAAGSVVGGAEGVVGSCAGGEEAAGVPCIVDGGAAVGGDVEVEGAAGLGLGHGVGMSAMGRTHVAESITPFPMNGQTTVDICGSGESFTVVEGGDGGPAPGNEDADIGEVGHEALEDEHGRLEGKGDKSDREVSDDPGEHGGDDCSDFRCFEFLLSQRCEDGWREVSWMQS